MAKDATIQMDRQSLNKLLKRMRRLPDKVARGVMRKGVRAGSTVIRKEAKRRVPVDSGDLRRAHATKIVTYKNPDAVVGITGVKKGVKTSRGRLTLAATQAVVEEGTVERTHKSGKRVGAVKATHYLEKALQAKQPVAFNKMVAKMKAEFPKAAARA